MTFVKNKWSIREKYKPALQEIKNQQRIKHDKILVITRLFATKRALSNYKPKT